MRGGIPFEPRASVLLRDRRRTCSMSSVQPWKDSTPPPRLLPPLLPPPAELLAAPPLPLQFSLTRLLSPALPCVVVPAPIAAGGPANNRSVDSSQQ